MAARTTVRAGRKGLAPSVAHVRPFVARGLTSRAADTVEVVRSTFRSVLGTPHVVACCRCNQPTPFIGASQMSNRKSATASKSRPSNTKRAAASKRGRRPKAAARAQRKKQAVVRSRKENHLRLVSGEATEAPIEVHNETKPDASEAENRTTRAAELDASLQPSLQKDSGAGKTVEGKHLILPCRSQPCWLIKRSFWKWRKKTCNLASNSSRSLRPSDRLSRLGPLLESLHAGGSP